VFCCRLKQLMTNGRTVGGQNLDLQPLTSEQCRSFRREKHENFLLRDPEGVCFPGGSAMVPVL